MRKLRVYIAMRDRMTCRHSARSQLGQHREELASRYTRIFSQKSTLTGGKGKRTVSSIGVSLSNL